MIIMMKGSPASSLINPRVLMVLFEGPGIRGTWLRGQFEATLSNCRTAMRAHRGKREEEGEEGKDD
jgi:hypothetical protein